MCGAASGRNRLSLRLSASLKFIIMGLAVDVKGIGGCPCSWQGALESLRKRCRFFAVSRGVECSRMGQGVCWKISSPACAAGSPGLLTPLPIGHHHSTH